MGFVMEFAENLILKLMEDPKERDRKFREHVYAVKDQCNKTKEMWPYLFVPMAFGPSSATIRSFVGMPKLARLPAGGTPTMISSNTALTLSPPELNECI
ncbi:hypothetical protein Prudu_023197 [Prunus dulcis]|uniref:Uncharacterized protein n=1 Tax=Prunus dulcis TaxID=3755 RepID=A0A4Y1S2Y2_PRUDU|nr:hypothetical protein Prudu_023197 [Prunus dulcis]